MDNDTASIYIDTYQKYYFESENEHFSYNSAEKVNALGAGNRVSPVDWYSEQYIYENKLLEGRFDELAFAWKSGKFRIVNNQIRRELFETTDGHGNPAYRSIHRNISIVEFDTYMANTISRLIEEERFNNIRIGDNAINNYEMLSELYDLTRTNSPNYFGPVYVITVMYCLSRGALPIFDSKAFTAIKALFYDVSPYHIYVENSNPGKNDTLQVINKYYEYINLLKIVFPDMIYYEGSEEFISRDLDRALWVYGHARRDANDIPIKFHTN